MFWPEVGPGYVDSFNLTFFDVMGNDDVIENDDVMENDV